MFQYLIGLWIFTIIQVGLVNGSVNVNVVGFPRGLENDDIIEWKGQAANRRTMGVLIIKNEDSSKKFRLEVHGFRNRISVFNKPGNTPYSRRICFMGRAYIRPKGKFTFQIRVGERQYRIYLNNKLVYTLPDSVPPSQIRSVYKLGSSKTISLKKMTTLDFAQQLNAQDCGVSTATGTEQYQNLCSTLNRSTNKIVGGQPALPGSLAWQASIRKKEQFAEGNPHQCGATLINSCWAISAGHCFPTTHSHSLRRLLVRVGDYFNNDTDTENNARFRAVEDVQDLNIKQVFKHHLYSSSPTARNDIALIQLQTCARLGQFVKPICLPTSLNQFPTGEKCTISGWGASMYQQVAKDHPSCLLYGEIRIQNEEDCARTFTDQRYMKSVMMCGSGVSSQNVAVDSCQGDSGGPMICGNSASGYTLVGITSWGIECGNVDFPGVYAKVDSFVKWIYLITKLSPNDENLRREVRGGVTQEEFCQFKRS